MTKIMIADDSMYARMLLKQAVAQIYPEAEFAEATSGQAVLDTQTEGTEIDWYLLDVNMGEPNGMDTAKLLIERGVNVNQITLVTGNKSSKLQAQADEISLNYINKAMSPTDVDVFIERLRSFFNG